MKNLIPAFFKKTSVIMIDDDNFFIESLSKLLSKDIDSDIICLNQMNKLYEKELERTSIEFSKFNKSKVETITNFLNSNNIVSTIVMDHYMTPKNGIDTARDLNNKFVQKILVSNMVTDKEAIKALNEKTIDFYLTKMDPNFKNNLVNTITKAQKIFFENLSSLMLDHTEEDNPLFEKSTENVFNEVKSQYKLPYYEPMENLKKFRFFDKDKKRSVILNFNSEQDIKEILNSYQAESASKDIIKIIKNGSMIPYFHNDCLKDGEFWLENLKSTKVLNGNKKYFYFIYEDEKNGTN